MPNRILGVEIPDHKRGIIALTSIYGISLSRAAKVLLSNKIDVNKKAGEWSSKDSIAIQQYIQAHYTVEGALAAEVQTNKKRLKDIGSYRGIRHRMGLPVRGQRTKTNARMRKGKRKTVAGKKKATKK